MSPLFAAPFALIAALVVPLLLGALELGYRIGRLEPVSEHQASTIAAPILALVGLLLAFSFSMASDRNAMRRQAAVQETNSIGTFWLQTSLFPEPTRSEMRTRVRRYVDLHFQHRLARIEESKIAAVEGEMARLQEELWALLVRDARSAPETVRLLLAVPALNAMFDDAETWFAARENRIPDAIFGYLALLVVSAAVVVGYRPRGEKRNLVLWATFTIVLSGVLLILVDLDRPRRGLIKADPTPYLRLRESMRPELP